MTCATQSANLEFEYPSRINTEFIRVGEYRQSLESRGPKSKLIEKHVKKYLFKMILWRGTLNMIEYLVEYRE